MLQIYFTGCAGDVTAGKYNDGSRAARNELTERLLAGMKAASRRDRSGGRSNNRSGTPRSLLLAAEDRRRVQRWPNCTSRCTDIKEKPHSAGSVQRVCLAFLNGASGRSS